MPAEPHLNARDLELLSAYIDGEITPAERQTLEQRLAREPELARELSALRQTVSWINALPPVRAPRNFTLTAEMVRRKPAKVLFFPATAFVSTMSAVAAVMLVAAGLLLMVQRDGGTTLQPLMSGEQAQVALAPTETPTLKVAPTDLQEPEMAAPLPAPTMEQPAAPAASANTAIAEDADEDIPAEAEEAAAEAFALEAQPTVDRFLPPDPAGRSMDGGPPPGVGAGGGADSPDENALGGPEAEADGESDVGALAAPESNAFAEGEGMFDMVPETGQAQAAMPADDATMSLMAPSRAEGDEEAEAADESEMLMQAEVAQVASPTATATETSTPTATATATVTPSPTATFTPEPTATPTPTPAPLGGLLPPGTSPEVVGLVLVVLGVLAFGVFAMTQAARRRR